MIESSPGSLACNQFETETLTELASSEKTNDETDSPSESCLVQIYPADVMSGMTMLGETGLTIGRELGCGLSLDDNNVSRLHAEIGLSDSGFVLTDAGSTNGTYVNGNRIERKELAAGDRIAVGSFIFKFLSADCIETQYHETVYSSLTRDGLTGTLNKRYLLEAMQREIARSRRDRKSLAIVMMDIDKFKIVNDTYGHLVGDQVLMEFGRRLSEICREDDFFARYGGEEFCLLLTSTDCSEAMEIAERCRQTVSEKTFSTDAGELEITCSFGVHVYHGDRMTTSEALISAADSSLYQAKNDGRNRVVCTPMSKR